MTFLYIFVGIGIFSLLMVFLGAFISKDDLVSAGATIFTVMFITSLIAGIVVWKSNINDEPKRQQTACFAEGKIWYENGKLKYGECMTEEQILMMKRLGQ